MSYTYSKNGRGKPRNPISTPRNGVSRRSSARGRNFDEVTDDSSITPSSGNVFLDMGFPPAEAEFLLLRTDLAIELEKFVRRHRLTQSAAAKLFGVTQPRISDLFRGKLERFSVDSLLEMLYRAGLRVEMRVKAA